MALGCEPGQPVLRMLRKEHCELPEAKKYNFVSVRPDSSKINGCKKRNVLFMLFQLLLSLLLLLRVLLWRYVITSSSLHVTFVADAFVAVVFVLREVLRLGHCQKNVLYCALKRAARRSSTTTMVHIVSTVVHKMEVALRLPVVP